jgi:hypothetical protein
MGWITYNEEQYSMVEWRVQCLNCDSILQRWNGICSCGLVVVKDGNRVWPYPPVRDVSVWKSPTGRILPQRVLDSYYLSRESDKTSTNTETSTSSSRGTY